MRTVLAVASSVAVVTAVALGTQVIGDDEPDRRPSSADPTGRHYEWSSTPAPLLLVLPDGDREVGTLGCWQSPPDDEGISSNGCADGGWVPASELDDAGTSETLEFWFGMPGWTWQAELIEPSDDPDDMDLCWRKAVVRATGEQTFIVEPAGPPGTYRLNLYGDGPEGSRGTDLRWTTTTSGPGRTKQCG